jgi:hypothetical protein
LKVAIVILNWNGEELINEFLPSVVKYTPSEIANIYLADNGSTDNSIEFVKTHFPDVNIISLHKNYGFAEGYNKAINSINEEYSVLLNSDVEVSENWLYPLLNYMEKHRDVAACQPKIRSYSSKQYFEYAGAAGGFIDKFGYPFCRGRLFNVIEQDKGQYDFITEIFWASGACLMIRTSVFKEVGGFDNNFFAHMEEIDLCWRLWARGYKVVCIPQSVVYHLGGATLNKMNSFKTYLNFRNNLFLLYKNLPNKVFYTLFIRFILDLIAFVKFLFSLEFKNSKAVIKAHFDFFRTYHLFKNSRIENLNKLVYKEISVIYKGSIVFNFFIRNKRYYSDL